MDFELTKAFLTFWAPNNCAEFHQNQIKIATIGARTNDASDVIITVYGYYYHSKQK